MEEPPVDYLNPTLRPVVAVEDELLFYRLYQNERQLSTIRKLESEVLRVARSLKYLKSNSMYHLRVVEGIFLGNIIGAKWMLSKRLGIPYSPLADLMKFRSKESRL
jgi:hypothetical protein